MRRNGINQNISLNDINPVHYYERVEAKKKKVLSTLPEKLVVPFKEKEKTKKKLAKWKRNDPLRKILQTNTRANRSKGRTNRTLLKILERVDLDRPILMHDKLDVIWGQDPESDHENKIIN